jgi:hypothetical protein
VDERKRKRARRARVEERREKRIIEKQLQSHAPPGFNVDRMRLEQHEDPAAADNFDYNTDFAPLPSSEAPEALVAREPQAGGGCVSFAKVSTSLYRYTYPEH